MVCGLVQLVGVVAVLSLTGGPRWSRLRVASLVLLALSPIGLVMAGIFTLDSLVLHLTAALLLFVTPVVLFMSPGCELPACGGLADVRYMADAAR